MTEQVLPLLASLLLLLLQLSLLLWLHYKARIDSLASEKCVFLWNEKVCIVQSEMANTLGEIRASEMGTKTRKWFFKTFIKFIITYFPTENSNEFIWIYYIFYLFGQHKHFPLVVAQIHVVQNSKNKKIGAVGLCLPKKDGDRIESWIWNAAVQCVGAMQCNG